MKIKLIIFVICFLIVFLIDSAITYVPDANTNFNHFKTIIVFSFLLFIPIAIIVHARDNLRKWLEKNKIFFEIFAAIALSGMSAFLSFKGNEIARQQTTLSELQIELAKIQIKPRLNVSFEQFPDSQMLHFGRKDGKTSWITYYIKIQNQGNSAAYNFIIDKKFFSLKGYVDYCNEIALNDLNPKRTSFPSIIEANNTHTMAELIHETLENKEDFDLVFSDLLKNIPIGIKILIRYAAEGFLDEEKEIQLIYILDKHKASVVCRSGM